MNIITATILLLCHVNTAWFLFEGENCTVPETNENGQCISIHDCDFVKKLLEQRKFPKVCGFVGRIPLACCPVSRKLTALKSGNLVKQKCLEYFKRIFDVVIIGMGEKALSKEFPHMAAVGYGDNKTSILWLCGGSLISHYFILSAAHCADSYEFGPAKWVRLGDLDLKNTTEDANPQDIRIAEIYVHPQYKPPSFYHDVALFRLEKQIYFGFYFKPACLHIEKNLSVNTLEATGWGKLGLFGEASSHLMKADLSVVDHETCKKKYADVSARKLANGILDEYQMCAGDASGRDTCPGDSGGPLHYVRNATEQQEQHFVVAGITSFGKGCGGQNSVGVYARVSSYIGWLENIVWQGDYD